MMANDGRCQVAAKLRKLAEENAVIPAWSVIACGELPPPIDDALHACGLGRAVHASEICDRLADLVEPEPERTCRIKYAYAEGSARPHAACSECGGSLSHYGTVDEYGEESMEVCPYCPHCGSRVVE